MKDRIGLFLFCLVPLLIVVWAMNKEEKIVEEHSTYHIMSIVDVDRDVVAKDGVATVTTHVWKRNQLASHQRTLIAFAEGSCPLKQLDSLKYEHSKIVNQGIDKIVQEGLK